MGGSTVMRYFSLNPPRDYGLRKFQSFAAATWFVSGMF
jgi:hypothetical protein